MNYNDAMALILNVVEPKKIWVKKTLGKTGAHEVWVCGLDLHLRIEIDHHDKTFLHLENFEEPWVKKFLHKGATSHYYRVYYGASLIDNVILVSVDGGRAQLPLPGVGNDAMKVPRYRYAIARIVTHSENDLDFAMKTAGFEVVDDE